jgi:hypothetical protein
MTPELEHARYIALVTFRRDGREVTTPVWCVALDGKVYAYSNGNAGKIKRIRATKRVRVAPSDGRGKPLGKWSEGTGRLVAEPDLAKRVYAGLTRKYGWQYRLIDFFAKLFGKARERIAFELTV